MTQVKPTFGRVRHMISFDPCHRTMKRATPAQLDYIARLILDCWGLPGFRWNVEYPESFTIVRATRMIDMLQNVKNFRGTSEAIREIRRVNTIERTRKIRVSAWEEIGLGKVKCRKG